MPNPDKLTPLFAYYGGKSNLSDWLIDHFPAHNCYCEPFGGMASVLLAKKPTKIEIYNDLNKGIVNLYRVLRDKTKVKLLKERLELTPYSRFEFSESRQIAITDPIDIANGDLDHAIHYAYCGLCCFGGDIGKGKPSFGVSYGTSNDITNGFREAIATISALCDRLRYVQIENIDAIKLIKAADSPEMLYFVDPPYLNCAADYKYRLESHTELLETILNLKGMVFISGFLDDSYSILTQNGWQKDYKERCISASKAADTGGKQVLKRDYLWWSPAAEAARKATMRQIEWGTNPESEADNAYSF